ncbi:Uracil-DNA glycosylase, mitochondrial-like protein [Drosera capensis]
MKSLHTITHSCPIPHFPPHPNPSRVTLSSSMPCAKTLMVFFPAGPNSKRPKTSSTTSQPLDAAAAARVDSDGDFSAGVVEVGDDENGGGAGGLTPEQRLRMEVNAAMANWKRNLRVCQERAAKAKDGGGRHAKLEELLVEKTWLEALPGELEKPYAKSLCKFVEMEISSGNVPIYPPPHLIFNALNAIPFDKVKVVILGQDPYHGPGQAMGLAFSVPEGVKVPSSLVNIFKELQQDLGCTIPSHGNLEKWAVQGVLLLNTVLTAYKLMYLTAVRSHQANSHAKKGWEQFTDAVIRTISQKKSGVVFLLWGNSARDKSRLIDESRHHLLKAAHPSGLSANRGFFRCRHFSQTNQILKQNGESPINWLL